MQIYQPLAQFVLTSKVTHQLKDIKMPVKLLNKYYDNGWYITAEVLTSGGSIVGPQFVDLPESATDSELELAILIQYVTDL